MVDNCFSSILEKIRLSKMKKQKNYSQLKEQEKSPERTNIEIDFTSLLDLEFKKEVIRML